MGEEGDKDEDEEMEDKDKDEGEGVGGGTACDSMDVDGEQDDEGITQ